MTISDPKISENILDKKHHIVIPRCPYSVMHVMSKKAKVS